MRPRRIIWTFQDFMRRRRLAKLCPETASLRKQRESAQRAHKRGVRDIERRQRAVMNGLLNG